MLLWECKSPVDLSFLPPLLSQLKKRRKGGTKKSDVTVALGLHHKKKKKQGIYCRGQKDDMDGFPSLHPIYRVVAFRIVKQIILLTW